MRFNLQKKNLFLCFVSVFKLTSQLHKTPLHYLLCPHPDNEVPPCNYILLYPSLLTESWQAKTLARCQQLLRRRSFPLHFTLSCTLDPASRWDYLCTLRKEKEVFYCCLVSLAQPRWGLDWGVCWILGHSSAPGNHCLQFSLSVLFLPLWHFPVGDFSPFLSATTCSASCPTSLALLTVTSATGVHSMATTHTATSPVRYA